MRKHTIVILALIGAGIGGGAIAVAQVATRTSAGRIHHARRHVRAHQAQASTDIRNDYGVFRRDANASDDIPHAPAQSAGRLARSDESADMFLLSKPGKSLCVVVLFKAARHGGTACGPEELATSRPPAIVSEGDGSSPGWRVFGAAPDNLIAATARTADGTTARSDVVNNSYSMTLPAPPGGITLSWKDGRDTQLVGG